MGRVVRFWLGSVGLLGHRGKNFIFVVVDYWYVNVVHRVSFIAVFVRVNYIVLFRRLL
jgi:hypothetical protein